MTVLFVELLTEDNSGLTACTVVSRACDIVRFLGEELECKNVPLLNVGQQSSKIKEKIERYTELSCRYAFAVYHKLLDALSWLSLIGKGSS